MTNKYYTSLKLSKLLKEAGCELIKIETKWRPKKDGTYSLDCKSGSILCFIDNGIICPTYHILEDICDKYCREFFGEKMTEIRIECTNIWDDFPKYEICTKEILDMLQQNKPKEEIEQYIWENCKFNPNNKEKEK